VLCCVVLCCVVLCCVVLCCVVLCCVMVVLVLLLYTAISIKVVHEQSGKVEYERERLLGIALKIH
jgi:hypothetical protein